MEASDVFCLALGIRSPWHLSRLDLAEGALHLHVDFERTGSFDGFPIHDTVSRTWRHGDFFQYRCEIHAEVPRIKKKDGSVETVAVPWARKGSGFTLLFERQAIWLCSQMPVRSASRYLRVHDTRLWRLIRTRVAEAHSEADYSDLSRIGVDETSSRRGHEYISVFVDLDRRRAVYACEGRSGAALAQFHSFLVGRGVDPAQIKEFCCDMSPAYLSGIEEAFPKAGVTLDRFHVAAMVGKAVDETRKEESKHYAGLKKTRYLWLRNPETLRESQREKLKDFLVQNAFPRTSRAYAFRLQFQEIFANERPAAEPLFDAWLDAALESGLEHIEHVAAAFLKMRGRILNWFSTRISNGLVEGLHSVLQAVKRRARGYRNAENLIAMSYLIHGKLRSLPL